MRNQLSIRSNLSMRKPQYIQRLTLGGVTSMACRRSRFYSCNSSRHDCEECHPLTLSLSTDASAIR